MTVACVRCTTIFIESSAAKNRPTKIVACAPGLTCSRSIRLSRTAAKIAGFYYRSHDHADGSPKQHPITSLWTVPGPAGLVGLRSPFHNFPSVDFPLASVSLCGEVAAPFLWRATNTLLCCNYPIWSLKDVPGFLFWVLGEYDISQTFIQVPPFISTKSISPRVSSRSKPMSAEVKVFHPITYSHWDNERWDLVMKIIYYDE